MDKAGDAVVPPPTTPPPTGRAFGVTWRLILLGVVIAAIAMTLAQSLRVYFAQSSEIAQLRADIDAERATIAHLEDQLQRWDDPEFVKAEARERLGWVMPGDVGYRVIGHDGEPIGGDSAVLGEEDTMTGPWYERLWGSVAAADQPVDEDEGDAGSGEPAPSPPPPSGTPTDEDE